MSDNSQQDAGETSSPAAEQQLPDGQAQDAPPETVSTETADTAPVLTIEELTAALADSQAHVSRLNGENKSRREELEVFQSADTERKRADMSEIEKLTADLAAASSGAADLETANGRLEALDALVAKQVTAEMKRLNVPEWAVGLLKEKSPAEQLAFLNDNAGEFGKTAVPDFNGRSGGGKENGLNVDEVERRRISSQYGVKEEFYK